MVLSSFVPLPFVVVTYAFLCSVELVVSASDAYYAQTKLVNDLLVDYDKTALPSPKSGIPVNVSLGLAIAQIVSVEEITEGVNLNVWHRMIWKDYRLVWDPKKYHNISIIMISSDYVWIPDITLQDPLTEDGTKSIGEKQDDEDLSWSIVLVPDGTVYFNFPGMIYGQCPLNIADYPFDQHNCSFMFSSWVHDEVEINFSLRSSNAIDFGNYVENNEWSVTSYGAYQFDKMYNCCPNKYKMVNFYISIKRGGSSYVSNYVIPSVLIITLSLMMFTLPPEVGKRMEIGINLLLCLSVYLTILNTKMPTRSDVFPLLSKFYGCCIFILTFALLCTCWVVTYYFHDMSGWNIYKMPKFVQIVLLHYLKKMLRFPSENKVAPFKKTTVDSKKTIIVKPRLGEENSRPKKRKQGDKNATKQKNQEKDGIGKKGKKTSDKEKGEKKKRRERSRSEDVPNGNERKEKRRRESIALGEIRKKDKDTKKKSSKESRKCASVVSTASNDSVPSKNVLDNTPGLEKREKKMPQVEKIREEIGLVNEGNDERDSVREAPSLKNKTEKTADENETTVFDMKSTPDREFNEENDAAAQESTQLMIHLAEYFSDNSQRKKNRYQWRQAAIVLNRLFIIMLIISIAVIIIAVFFAR